MNVRNLPVDLLAHVLDAASLRQTIIAQNVANVNTPQYHQLTVAFEDELAQALDRGNLEKAVRVAPEVVKGPGGAMRLDGNNVDIDVEMARLTKNTLLYQTVAQAIAVQLAQMRSAISGRV